jgi:acylphosphatase
VQSSAPNPQQIYFLVHGTVQGVFFRAFTISSATRHSLTGYVRNTDNGKVEGEAQGREEGIQALLKDLNHGPKGARVVRVDWRWVDVVDGEVGFEQRK